MFFFSEDVQDQQFVMMIITLFNACDVTALARKAGSV